jgi:hypothetical protein
VTVSEAATTEDEETPAETKDGTETSETPQAARTAYAAEDVADELRKVFLAVVAASALLERTGKGSAHPALRRADRCAEDALSLASHAEGMIYEGIREVREQLGELTATSVGEVVSALDVSRTRLAEAAERVAGFPGRLRAAGQQLRDSTGADEVAGPAPEKWSHAADDLRLMTDALIGAVSALATYTDRLTGAAS